LNKDTSLQKAAKITEQDQELPMEEEKHPWIYSKRLLKAKEREGN